MWHPVEVGAAATCSISWPPWNVAPSVTRHSNFRTGFLSRRPRGGRNRLFLPPAEAYPSTSTAPEENNKPLAFTLQGIDPHHPYLAGRGVGTNTAAYFGTGFYSEKGLMEGRIIIPIHNEDGILVAYAGRGLGQTEPRYKFPVHFRKSLVLFNLHRAVHHGKAVIVVEGFFDCFNVYQAGFPCVVALMGCSLSHRQEALLQHHFRQVTLMLDGDNAGRRAGAMIAARLATKLAVRVVEDSTWYATGPALRRSDPLLVRSRFLLIGNRQHNWFQEKSSSPISPTSMRQDQRTLT